MTSQTVMTVTWVEQYPWTSSFPDHLRLHFEEDFTSLPVEPGSVAEMALRTSAGSTEPQRLRLWLNDDNRVIDIDDAGAQAAEAQAHYDNICADPDAGFADMEEAYDRLQEARRYAEM